MDRVSKESVDSGTVLRCLVHIWKEHVIEDYFQGRLTHGEQVVHASLSHHLRTHLSSYPDFHVWHEVQLSKIHHSLTGHKQTSRMSIDLMLVRAEQSALVETCNEKTVPRDLTSIQDVTFLVAIEVKYAKPDKSDIERLAILKRDYLQGIHPVFAYIPGTDWNKDELGDWLEQIEEDAKSKKVKILLANPWDASGWKQYGLDDYDTSPIKG